MSQAMAGTGYLRRKPPKMRGPRAGFSSAGGALRKAFQRNVTASRNSIAVAGSWS